MDAMDTVEMIMPPRARTDDGRHRRIGVEIEFANLDSRAVARLVQRRFGGRVEEVDPHRFRVADTEFGDVEVELDTRYAHRGDEPVATDPGDGTEGKSGLADELERGIHSLVGDIGSLWLPVEIAAPPVPIERLPELNALIRDLRDAGAEGTDEGLLFAFATQLNPEVPSLDTLDILRHLKAFLLLSDWLRQEIDLDVKRRLLPFVDPFPGAYIRRVVDPAYAPTPDAFIDDYLDANPTRNRELDLLPVVAEIDPARVRARIDDPRIKARPAFHYRLPDTRLRDPRWGLVTEWNRWVRVEQLAADEAALHAAAEAYLSRRETWRPEKWMDAVASLFR